MDSVTVEIGDLSLESHKGDKWYRAERIELPWWKDSSGRNVEGDGTPYVVVLGATMLNGRSGAVEMQIDYGKKEAALTKGATRS